MDRRVMLVTGGGRGIGAAVARVAAAAGYAVAVNYRRDAASAQAVVAAIESAGGQAVALQADVGQPDEVARLFEAVDARLGPLDVLVNNAGVAGNFRVDALDHAQMTAMFQANVFSAFLCAGHAVRRMSTAHGGRGGVIVTVSSVAARTGGREGGVAYAASKAALDAFTVGLSKEVGREGIRVNAVRPGLIATDMHALRGGLEQMERLAASAVPMGRSGSADEVAQTVVWLASAQASYVHGAVLDVSGGR